MGEQQISLQQPRPRVSHEASLRFLDNALLTGRPFSIVFIFTLTFPSSFSLAVFRFFHQNQINKCTVGL